jgi:hypothetical protein
MGGWLPPSRTGFCYIILYSLWGGGGKPLGGANHMALSEAARQRITSVGSTTRDLRVVQRLRPSRQRLFRGCRAVLPAVPPAVLPATSSRTTRTARSLLRGSAVPQARDELNQGSLYWAGGGFRGIYWPCWSLSSAAGHRAGRGGDVGGWACRAPCNAVLPCCEVTSCCSLRACACAVLPCCGVFVF